MDTQFQILVADDDYEDRMIMEECFKELGHAESLQFVDDGVTLLQHLDHDHPEQISLIVLDMNMSRLNGAETLKALKDNPLYHDIPVIIFSTTVNDAAKANCMQLGAIDFITKPSRWNAYKDTCENLYSLSQRSAA